MGLHTLSLVIRHACVRGTVGRATRIHALCAHCPAGYACAAACGGPTRFATAEGGATREFAAASARREVRDALPAGATREQRRAALDKVADAFKCAGADGLKRHFVDADPKKGKRSLAAQLEHAEDYLRRGGYTLQTLREREHRSLNYIRLNGTKNLLLNFS